MMSGVSNCVLDRDVCDACEHLFTKKDKIIDDLKRNLQRREDQVQDLENEIKKLQGHMTIEKVASEPREDASGQPSVEESESNDGSAKDRNLELLRNQLKHLEEEKKHLNEKIYDFEHETAGLARMFGMQQEKFEYDIKNKDELIKSIEKERKRFEGELEKNKDELDKLRKHNESEKMLVENLKTAVEKKDEEILHLSHLHNETKNLLKHVEEKFILSDGNLKNEQSKNKMLEENVSGYMDDIEIVKEEINSLRNSQTHDNEKKSRLQKEIQKLKDNIECLQHEVKESRNICAETEKCNAKLEQDKNDKECEVRNMERKDMILRKEIVLLTDQRQALETKINLVQEEIKNLNTSKEKLEQQLLDSNQRLQKAEEYLEQRTTEKDNLEDEVKALEQAISDFTIKNKQQNELLEKAVEDLKDETREKEKLQDAIKVLDQVRDDLKNNINQQNTYFEETKRELDIVLATKQQLLMKTEKLEDLNKELKIKINSLSEEIENMNGICQTKAIKIEDLEEIVGEKSRIIMLHEKKENELQNHIEELLSMDEIRTNELKNATEAITKLRKENSTIEDSLEKITVQFQERLQERNEINDLYLESRAQNERQVEELSRFRELNAEINNELKNRNDEISLLNMEKDELLRELESKQDLIEKKSSIQRSLNEEVESMKTHIEKYKENEKGLLQKLSDAKRKHEIAIRHCDNEKDEKNDLELQLKYSREKNERWKKLSFEIKEERNRLQMQIAELDRDLNEKHLNLAEEKSSLENEMETLKNVIKRLKSNEEKLREKIEKLRDEVNKLSDVNSEQEMEIRKLSWEKEKMLENLARLKSVSEENSTLKNESNEINQEKVKLKNDMDTLQEKARYFGDENEKLQKEMNLLQDQFDVVQSRVFEGTQEYKQLKNECDVLKDEISELSEEKERLSNENFRLKEKKNSIIEERNKLQDMIESLDKCHSEKNDTLSQQNTLLKNELESRRLAMKKCEEKESKLLNEIQELNAKIEKSTEEFDQINGHLKKTDGENIRLRKKVADLGKLVEHIEQEKDSRICLQTELNEKEQLLSKYKESKRTLNDLISTLYCQQNELKDRLRIKERELSDLNDVLETEQSDKRKSKDRINKLEEELRTTQTREHDSINLARNEKEKYKQAELALDRVKKERNDLKETSRKNEDDYNKTIQELENEIQQLLDKICVLENDNNEGKLCNDNLDTEIKNLKEEINSLAEAKSQLVQEKRKKNEQLGELAKETDRLNEENKRLQEHAENINRILYLQNSAAVDQASGMGKEINILHDTLTELRNNEETNRVEIVELKKKLNSANEDKMNIKTKMDDICAEREKLECKNNELLSTCARLEKVAKKGARVELQKDETERSLETELQKNRLLSEELASKIRDLLEKEEILTNLKKELSDHKETVGKLNMTNEELVATVEELAQINEEGLKDFTLTNDKNEQLLSENTQLIELVKFHKDEVVNLQRETDRIKTDLEVKFQETENDKLQLQSDVNMKDENLRRLIEKNNEILERLKNTKDEVDDLENENEDLLAEIDQLKEVNNKVKDVLCSLQSDHGVLQEELRDKENKWNKEKEKTSLEVFKMKTDIENLNDRITQANERNEKQRELEKMLRLEIDELSDGYVELEEDVQHRNDDNLLLRERLQAFSQNIEELELARDTACLLKEKRHCELLKSEKNAQSLEKQLRVKKETNKKLQKELDSATEKENFLKLQISSEKELSGQRLKQIQDMQNSQRQVDEHLWKAKRDIEKLETEIETWRTSSDSMKVRIDTLDDELNKTENEKHVISELYKETKKISEAAAKEILELKSNFAKKTTSFESIVGEMNNEKSNLNKTLKDLEGLMDKKSVEVNTMTQSIQILNDKYEDSLLMISLLHNDIQRKEERISGYEERRKLVTNSLMDLDLKIEEIQGQAEGLETDNEFLRQQLARSITAEEDLRQALKNKQQIFADKHERNLREMKHIQEMKDYYAQLALEASSKVEDKSNALSKLQTDHDKLISDKDCLKKTKYHLENELRETKLQEEKLKQTLNSEKEKTLRQTSEIEQILKDVDSTRAKYSKMSEELKETENKFSKVNVICQEQEGLLEEQKAEILKIREDCENWKHKANHMEESFSVSTIQNEKLQLAKNEEIRLLIVANSELKNVVHNVNSKLDEQTARNNTSVFENESLKEKLEQKKERLKDLEISYQKTLNLKNSLEAEKKGLLAKLNNTSRNLETLKTTYQQLIAENKDLNCVIKTKEEEFEEVSNVLQLAQQRLENEIFNHKTTLDNLLVENIELRKKINVRDTQLEETTKSLQEISCNQQDQEKENKRLKLEIGNLNFERNCLADANLKVSDALGKLSTESRRNEAQHRSKSFEFDTQTSGKQGELDSSWQAKQLFAMKSFELQNNFVQVENEIHKLRSLVSEKEYEVTRLQESLKSLEKEMGAQCLQVSNYKQKVEDEYNRRQDALDAIKQLETDLEHLKEEKFTIVTEYEEKFMHMQHEVLCKEIMICTLRENTVKFEDTIREMKSLDAEKTEQMKKLESLEITRIREREAVDKIMQNILLQIWNLEESLLVRDEHDDTTISSTGEYNRLDKYKELFSTLTSRFERVLSIIQSHLHDERKLEKDLNDAKSQSSIYRAQLQASEAAFTNLKNECEQLHNELSLLTFSRDEALHKVAGLSESLLTAENKMERARILQNEENSKISQELQKMQRELTLVCEKFNCSIAKTKSQEEKIETKEKRIADLEESVKMSCANERMLQMKIAELETTSEILLDKNNDLENTEKDQDMKITALKLSLQQEKAERLEDIAERVATIRQLELKNENSQKQVLRSKELLAKAEQTIKELQKESKTLQSRYKESETVRNAEIADCQSEILQLRQNILNLEEDSDRLRNDRCALTKAKEYLLESISNVEKENDSIRNILEQNKQDKEIQNKSLGMLFDVALAEKISNDLNDRSMKLEKVVKVIEDLRHRQETLTKEKKDVLEHMSKLTKEYEELQIQNQSYSKDNILLKQHSIKLADEMKKLKDDIARSKSECKQLNARVQELEENVDTLKVNESQQHYQYHVLEKEKEELESEIIYIEEGIERLTEKLNQSVEFRHDFQPSTTIHILDDSGIAIEENPAQLISSSEPSDDSGAFSSGLDKSIAFPFKPEDENVGNENMRNLEAAVTTCVQMVSKVSSTLNERSKSFSTKEQNFTEEIRTLKQASVQNEDLLSSLEEEVERLELSQNMLQETYREKDENLKECQMKLEHSITIANQKETSITILNESVREFKKQQEFLETEINKTKMANEQLNKEKVQAAITIQDYEKTLEEHRQQRLESDAENEKRTKGLRIKITELENQILKQENTNFELSDQCAILRGNVDELNNREKEHLSTITSYQDQVYDLEKEKRNISQVLDKSKKRIVMLETTCKEKQESVKEIKQKLQTASVALEESRRDVDERKEENIRLKLDRDSLKDEAKIGKKQLKEQKTNVEHMSTELRGKDELLRKNDTKLKLVEEFLQEINKSKDSLEKDFRKYEKENEHLREHIEELKEENNCLSENINLKEEELIEKDDLNRELGKEINEIKNKLVSNNAAFIEVTDKLRISLGEVKRVKCMIEDLNNLFSSNTGYNSYENDCLERMDIHNLILSTGKSLNNLTIVCQKSLVERGILQKNVESIENEKSTLQREKCFLNDKASALSKAFLEVKSSLRKQEQELDESRNELSNEKKKNDELRNVNLSLKGQINILEDNVFSISTQVESLKIDRKNLEESLLKAQNQVVELNLKREHMDVLNEELWTAEQTRNELKYLQKKTVNEKEDVEKELKYTQRRLSEHEKLQEQQTKLLNDTQITLTQERERIVTLTKLARIKEHDLENAKVGIKLKDELITQMKDQIEEIKDTNLSTKEELAKVAKQLTTVQQHNEILSNEKVSLWKDCAVLKDRLKQVQNEKQNLETKLGSEKKTTSIASENLENQTQMIKDLRNEVNLQKQLCEKLENEKLKITNEAKDKEKRLELEYEELLERYHTRSKSYESTLLHMKSELSLSESLRSELQQRIAGNEIDLSALQNENLKLQEEVETCTDTIKELTDRESNLIADNNYLKDSARNTSDESERLKNCYNKTQEHLRTIKTNLAEKERENDTLQKEVLSGKEIIYALRNEALNSKSEINDLKCKALENTQDLEKVNKELAHERNTVATLIGDKTNLEELYQLSQNQETNMRKNLQDTKLQINEIRNENLTLKKENVSLHCNLEQSEKTIKDLTFDTQSLSLEKQETNKTFTEAIQDLEKANEDLNRVCSAVGKIGSTAKTILNAIHGSQVEQDNECSPHEAIVKRKNQAVDTLLGELRTIDISLKQIDSSVKNLLERETTLKDDMNELTDINKRLNDQDERQEDKLKTIQEDRNNFLQSNKQLQAQNKKLTTSCQKLKDECKRVEELLSNECTITREMLKELSTLKDEGKRLREKNGELEENLDQYVKENVDLNAKHKEIKQENRDMCEQLSSLERNYSTLCKEKRKSDEKNLKSKEHIVLLEKDLEASVEFSELVEKRYAEESENNTKLQARVETLDNQICCLENNLKTSLSQIEEMNAKVVLMNEEIRETGFALDKKESEVARLQQELNTNIEELRKCTVQLQTYKSSYEDTLKCEKETKDKLEQTELLLKGSVEQFHQEKQVTNSLIMEKEVTEKELQSNIKKLQERFDEVTSELSTTTANEKAMREKLDYAKDSIKQLEKDLQEQLVVIKEYGEKQKEKDEAFDVLKMNYASTEAEFGHENEELKQNVGRLESKIILQSRESQQHLAEIENLKVQFASEKKAKEHLQSETLVLQKELDFLKKQKNEKEKQIDCIMKNKTVEVDQISAKFQDEINKSEDLQSKLDASVSARRKLEQINEDVSEEVLKSCQSLVRDLKPTELGESCDDSLVEESGDVADLSKIINIVHSTHTLIQNYNNLLNTKITELREELRETEFEKTQLNDHLHKVKKQGDMVQVNCNSLTNKLEICQKDLELKGKQIQTLESEINEFKQTEKRLQETIEMKNEKHLVLQTKMEVLEEKRASFEDEVSKLQWKLGNTIIELTTANTTNEILESKNSELIFTNSRLLDDQMDLKNKLNAADKNNQVVLQNFCQKENEFSELKTKCDLLEQEKSVAEKSLEEKETEFSQFKDNVDELEKQKHNLEKKIEDLKEINRQTEKDHINLQLTNSQIQAENAQFRRDDECKRNAISKLQCDLEEAFTSLEKQHNKLSQVQMEKHVVQVQLMEAEKELRVLMEDNAQRKHQMYQTADDQLTTRREISQLKCKEATLLQENKHLADQLRARSEELEKLKLKEQKVTREMENNREKMRRYLNDRDKWEEQVKSVISEISQQ